MQPFNKQGENEVSDGESLRFQLRALKTSHWQCWNTHRARESYWRQLCGSERATPNMGNPASGSARTKKEAVTEL